MAVPPKEDYAEILDSARRIWNRSGNFLLISSTRVYSEQQGGNVNEESPIKEKSLLGLAENLALKDAGMVLRLAGLYDDDRGPHKTVHANKTIGGSPASFLNLIHTQDAAELALNCLLKGPPREIFLGCDNNPITRRKFVDLVCGIENDITFSVSDDLGKICNNERTRMALKWEPSRPSFESWWHER